ncbi:MAG: hypothetical protein GY839_10330 [candidate division Zixibacteria bacterium]|nr:hypothetical protein [candidate division Zixibacteria bacterium]
MVTIDNITTEKLPNKKKVDQLSSFLSASGDIFNRSEKNLNDLINNYKGEYENFAAFIGAGLSKPLGISDWKKLIKKMIAKCSESFIEKYNDFENSNPHNYPDIADEIFEEYRAMGNDELFFGTIKEHMEQEISSTSITLVKVILAIKCHLTTNFDTSIEEAYKFIEYFATLTNNSKDMNLVKRYLDDLNIEPKSEVDQLYYLHADINKNLFILRTKDYENFYDKTGSKQILDLLKRIYLNKHIIFIGFSFEDRFVKKCITDIAFEIKNDFEKTRTFYREHGKENKSYQRKHFLLIGKNDTTDIDFFNSFEKIGIYPVIYDKGKHIFIEKLFHYLSFIKQGITNE